MAHCCFKWSTRLTFIINFFICSMAFINQGSQATTDDGTEFNLRCYCSSGWYERATVEVLATTDICNDDAAENETFNKSTKMLVRMKICRPCWSGCETCVGPRDLDCLKCNKDFLLVKTPDVDAGFLKSEQLLMINSAASEVVEESSGDGPTQTEDIVRCVSTCPVGFYHSNADSTCEFCGSYCNESVIETMLKSEDEKETPAGYYAIPPLIILGVGAVFLIAYLRKKRRLAEGSWKHDNMVIRRGSSAESKTFIAVNQKTHQVPDYRVGNQYVYVDRPLPQHPLHRGHHGGSIASSCWSGADHDDPDVLYETPENRKGHHHRSAEPHKGHLSDKINKARSRSLDDCLHKNAKPADKHRPTKPRSGSLESSHPPQLTKKPPGHAVPRNSADPMEVPNYHAPPTPVRYVSNNPKRRIHNEHIYVNVEENA